MNEPCAIAAEIKVRINEHRYWYEFYSIEGLFYARERVRIQERNARKELDRHIETCSICREAEMTK